jgi:hypothetical protein
MRGRTLPLVERQQWGANQHNISYVSFFSVFCPGFGYSIQLGK